MMGLALGLEECLNGQMGQEIKKDMARCSRAATKEFRKARESDDFVQKLIAREVALPAKTAQMQTMNSYVDDFRDIFAGHVIHRTIKSVDWRGEPISGLPPLHEKVLALQPSAREKAALMVMANEIVNDENATKGKYLNRADNVSVFSCRFCKVQSPDQVGCADTGSIASWGNRRDEPSPPTRSGGPDLSPHTCRAGGEVHRPPD